MGPKQMQEKSQLCTGQPMSEELLAPALCTSRTTAAGVRGYLSREATQRTCQIGAVNSKRTSFPGVLTEGQHTSGSLNPAPSRK